MKKNVIFLSYLLLIVIITGVIFKPNFGIIAITLLVNILSIFSKTLLSLDQSDKKEAIIPKIFVLLILSAFALFAFKTAWEINNTTGDTPGIKMLFYDIFFAVLGLNIYIIYSYSFEKQKKLLFNN